MFVGCACSLVRGVVWCGSDANLVQNRFKIVLLFSSPVSSGRLPIRSFLGTGAKYVRSVRSARFIQFSSQTLPALVSAKVSDLR